MRVRGRRSGKITPNNEGDLSLDLGLHQSRHGDILAIEVLHVAKQHAKVGLVDAKLCLHCFGCETHFEPRNTSARGQCGLGVDLRHCIGCFEALDTKACRNGCDGYALRTRMAQGLRRFFMVSQDVNFV